MALSAKQASFCQYTTTSNVGLPQLPLVASARRLQRQNRSIKPVFAAAAEQLTQEEPSATSSVDVEDPANKPFPYHLPLDPQQQFLSSIPLPLFYPAVLACMGVAGVIGIGVGKALPVESENKDIAGYVAAAAGAAAVAAASVQAKKKRDSAAVVALYNAIVDLPDPVDLTPDMVQKVGSSYGIDLLKDDLDGLCKVYSQYLETLIPSGDQHLRGDEGDKLIAFKNALGLSDEVAAPLHIEVARRLFRQGYESKDRNLQFEQRKAFQRLIYVSQIVFGETKAAYLLPWRRLFNVTVSQVEVAHRDNARAIFRSHMEQVHGGDLRADRHMLRTLREYQQKIKMTDKTAAEVVREAARKHTEALLEKAITATRATAKARDPSSILGPVQEAIEYSRKLARYANDEDLIPGLGAVSLAGGSLTQQDRQRDLKDLYKVFIEERMERTGEFDSELERDAGELQVLLGLSASAAQLLQDEVAARLYRRLLKEAVAIGKLDSAESPAEVLGELCDKVKFSPEAALELHKGLYKAKLMQLAGEGRALTDSDANELARIRRILCLPAEVAKKAQKETVGKKLEEVISDIYMMGAKPVAESELARIDQTVKELRMDPEVAQEVFAQVTRERLRAYVQQALKERGSNQDRKAAAAALKKVVQFNSIVVTPLLERVKGMDAAKKELAEIMAKAMEAAKAEGAEGPEAEAAAAAAVDKQESVTAVQKQIAASRGEFGADEERKGQKEITLKEDVSAENRALLYKDFLMSTMQGEVVELPVGGMIRRKSSQQARSADMARLQSLADVLGMTQAEIMSVQGDLAEQAYKAQATEVMRSGPMTEEKVAFLEDMRNQLGLAKDKAEAAVKAVRTEVYGSQAATEDGKWTLERIAEVTSKGGSIEGLVEEVTRRNLYRRELEKALGDGTGDLSGSYFREELPKMLALEDRKVKMVLKELAGTRRRMLLVQAISQYRQKRPSEVVGSLNNLLSATRALPGDAPLAWTEHSELREVFSAYCARVEDEAKREELGRLLGLTQGEMEAAMSEPSSSEGKRADEDEDDMFF